MPDRRFDFLRRLHRLVWIGLIAAVAGANEAPTADPVLVKLAGSAQKAVGYLLGQQNPDGSWGRDPKTNEARGNIGLTAVCLYSTVAGPDVDSAKATPATGKALAWLLACQNDTGAFAARGEGNENYYTANVVLALCAIDRVKYKPQITRAVNFLRGLQCDQDLGYDPDRHPSAFGGQGYGSSLIPDLSNTQFFLEALAAAGHDKDSAEFKNALVFLRRCQASAEINDREWALNIDPTRTDKGGAIYSPNRSEAGTVTDKRTGNKSWRAYGSMTYAMVKSYLYCNLKPDSPELKAAWQFIRSNYTVDQNPGMDKTGLFYYYVMMSKALNAYGKRTGSQIVKDAEGKDHDWSAELADKLISLQQPDGSWVNTADRWWESDPKLVTAYVLICYSQIQDARKTQQ